MLPTTTGWFTGPQDAVPTMPTPSVGTPFSTRFCGGTICTYRSGTISAVVFTAPCCTIGMRLSPPHLDLHHAMGMLARQHGPDLRRILDPVAGRMRTERAHDDEDELHRFLRQEMVRAPFAPDTPNSIEGCMARSVVG